VAANATGHLSVQGSGYRVQSRGLALRVPVSFASSVPEE
jgi:hypothetical protein